jgi:hypothetical protein
MTSANDDAESLTVEVPGSSNGTLRKERDNVVEDGVDVIDNPSGFTLNAVGSNLSALETVDINEPYLGGEPMHFGEDVERESLVQILKTLTQEEKVSMNDITMPIRHLRAEKGSVPKAVAKIRETLAWRRDFDVARVRKGMHGDDTEMREILLRENETGKIYCRGFDAQGRALMYMRPSRENTNNELNNMRHLVWSLEKAIACTRRKSVELGATVPLEKINLVIDYDGFQMRHAPPMSTSRYTLDILQKHYPERMYRAYVVHPPFVFRTFWMLVRPFVDPTTKEKICFCSGKKGIQKLTSAVTDVHKLEPCAGGETPMRDFDSKEYMTLPLNHGFDE